MSELSEHLSHGELNITGRLVDASNATLFGTCTYKGVVQQIIYKPIAGERPLWDFAEGTLAARECAAFLLSDISGWSVVPVTVMRDGPFGEGMVQEWIEIDKNVDLAEFYRTDDPQLRTLALFDAVINNTDRKIGHLLPRSDGKLFGCDHGVTFHQDDKLRTVLWQWADQELTVEEQEELANLLNRLHKERSDFLSYLSESEFAALLVRIEGLITTKRFPVPSEEWPAIPWPPF